MQPVDLHTFVKDLKITKKVSQKQCKVVDNLFIYFNDLKVYKVAVQVNPAMLKKAAKLGLYSEYTIIYFDDIPIKIDLLKQDPKGKKLNADKGRYIAIYNPNTADCTVYHGEEDESDQVKHRL